MRKAFHGYGEISLVCGLFLLMGFLSLNQMLVYTPDSARYLIWANSLARAEGFKDATTPEPSRYVIHAPLFPLLLAPSAFFFPNNIIAAKTTTLFIGCLAIVFLYLWLKKKAGNKYALAGSILLAFNPLMMLYSTQILSDIPFAMCIILFFILADKLLEEQGNWKTEALFIAVIIAGIFLREVGLTLMFGATVFFIWKKQGRRAVRILVIALLFYLLWYIRNEIIVAGTEDPPLRNTRDVFMHLYTSNHASLFEEFIERLRSNIGVYKDLVGKLVFMPDFSSQPYMVISTTDPFVVLIQKLIPVGQYILIGVTLGFSVIGVRQLRGSKALSLIIVFLLCYLGPVIFYPVIDVRFLFPVLIIMIYLSVIGVKAIVDKYSGGARRKLLYYSGMVLLSLFLLPNAGWMYSYVSISWKYRQSPENFYQETHDAPEMFTKPLFLAAKWIMQHSDSSTVILSRWKELAIWLEGRKLVESNPRMNRDQFNYQLRDYRVKYIVAVRWRSPINEYETLFIQSDRFLFNPVYSVGKVIVYEVKPKGSSFEITGIEMPDSSIHLDYDKALNLLEDKPLESERILKEIVSESKMYTMVLFHIAVAKEFAGQLDSAALLFEKFRTFSQAAPYVQQAQFHLEMIAQLKIASYPVTSVQHAELFQKLAMNYWGLGYRKRAMSMLSQSLEAEPQFYPSFIISAVFLLQQGDTVAAWKYLSEARDLQPTGALVSNLTTIQKCADELQITASKTQKIELRMKIAESYIAMGLRDIAIDELQSLLRLDPSHQAALRKLAELYEMKHRYEPALRCYKTIIANDPENSEAREKISILQARF